MRVNIIGAGIGGMATAALLASKDHQVYVYEKNAQAGGKMNQQVLGDFRFDTGPSLLTMPFVLEKLFSDCGKYLNDYVTMEPVEPICRYFWQDGTEFNCWQDVKKTLDEIRLIAPSDIHAYKPFLSYAEKIYERTSNAFLFNPLNSWRDFLGLPLTDMARIDALTTVSKRIDSKFSSPYLRQFFKRFTTYNGSSPYQAPATLNVIPHVELNQGGYYVKGGLYELANALRKLAEDSGATFVFGEEVESIVVENKRTTGLQMKNGEVYPSDIVVSNSDATESYLKLLSDNDISPSKKKKVAKTEPSCSGFVLLLGISKTYEKLVHHNIFFSNDYENEFHDIFEKRVMPYDPTIYVANTSYSDKEHAPKGGSNLFVLVNAPYQSDNWNWAEKTETYSNHVISLLEKRGLADLSSHIVEQDVITPDDFYEKYRSNKGSIYGTSSNDRFSAFARPRNKSKEIDGLYLTGGSTHPGGGIPLCVLSAQHATTLIMRDFR